MQLLAKELAANKVISSLKDYAKTPSHGTAKTPKRYLFFEIYIKIRIKYQHIIFVNFFYEISIGLVVVT